MTQEPTIIFSDKEYARIEAVKDATGMSWHDLIVESFAKAEDEVNPADERIKNEFFNGELINVGCEF